MNIYQKKFYWKIGLLFVALIIAAITLLYNNQLAKKLATEERKKIEIHAFTVKEVGNPKNNLNLNLVRQILTSNTTIPVIITDEQGNITEYNNLDIEKVETEADSLKLQQIFAEMKSAYEPIPITLTNDIKQYVYYQDSSILKQLRFYPWFQLMIIAIFLGVTYLAFSSARKAEQDQVWVGMARETAHQLGTPLSSLGAWLDNLGYHDDTEVKDTAKEMENDVARLNQIADRFSKIGAKPKLQAHNLVDCLNNTYSYVKRRAANKIQFSNNFSEFDDLKVNFSPPLLDWVVENLLKNALDALKGQGEISLKIQQKNNKILIDVSDTGCGIAKSKFGDVFKPGFTSKKRGWGLGLSLSKRIIEQYHKGQIFVHKSTIDKGTTFRIQLPNK